MSIDLHLLKRGAVYWWRRRLPRAYAHQFGSSHLMLSLRTREPTAARRLGRRLSVAFDEAMHAIELERRAPTPDEQRAILHRLYELVIDRCDQEAASYYTPDEIPADAFPSNAERQVAVFEPAEQPGDADADDELWADIAADAELQMEIDQAPIPAEPSTQLAALELSVDALRELEEFHMFGNPDEASAAFRQHLLENRLLPIRALLEPILADFHLDAANDSLAFRRFLRDATAFAASAFQDAAMRAGGADTSGEMEAMLDAARRETRFLVPMAGAQRPTIDQRRAVVAVAPTYAEHDPACLLDAPLSECVAGYVKSKAGRKWAEKQAKDAEPCFRLLIDFFGDVPAASVRRAVALQYRDALARVPTATRNKPFKGLTMWRMTEIADAIETGLAAGDPTFVQYADRPWIVDGKVDRFSLKNQDKYVLYAHGLFEYILDTSPLDVRARNPFDRLLHGEETIKQRRGEVRAAWTTDEIAQLLASPVWAGSKSAWYRTAPGDLIIRDERFWIPIICLFGGLRLGEACQLKARDIEVVDGTPFFYVRRGRGQKVKNASSLRAVPVHRQLIAADIMAYVDERRGDGEGWLFPARVRGKHRKKAKDRIGADEFSRWFGRYRTAIGISDDEHDFHCNPPTKAACRIWSVSERIVSI